MSKSVIIHHPKTNSPLPVFPISVTGARNVGVILESILPPNGSPKPGDYIPLASLGSIYLSLYPMLCLNLASSFLTLMTALASLYTQNIFNNLNTSLCLLHYQDRSKFPLSLIWIVAIAAQLVSLSLPVPL